MSEKLNQTSKKGGGLLSVLLLLVLAGLGFFTFTLYQKNQKNESQFAEQKNQIIDELNLLKKDYDEAIETSGRNAEELEQAKQRISAYIDSLKSAKADVAALWKYRQQVQVLKDERTKLLAINDSLRRSNVLITQERDSTANVLNVRTSMLDSVSQRNTEMSKTIEEGSVLVLRKFEVEGVKERSGGRYVSTERSRASDKIRICYTVAVNRIAPEGDRFFYVQVLSPSGVTLGKNETVSVGDKTVNYTTTSRFVYEKKPVDVCEYISKPNKDTRFEGGLYTVKVFDEQLREIGTTEFQLK
ncbi:hypothetical protein [Capnocytophaga catalasegens]|uniref:Chromosome partitioning protein ParA n=1 Tax=Capnocytophaga catalasegens TaxID=1004260 RepID=A0AAV5ATW6_9FLAO|nr:hypothetical protein [Capnocytophaga catalasegens]GIZ14150.1 hypothetical protein RCZ03_01510 [Capnocytophaga catalasegens]GJM49944.1 hypothetical protein RCZ15_09190 [Capnocytophaga catalasegens]GJM51715.1 hypothetical protein RCZ16_00330 [Capnocytophaga catalasegens]